MSDLLLVPPDAFVAPRPDLGPIIELARHIDPATLLYLTAAVVVRFWHKHIWLIYLALAVAPMLVSGR